MNYELERIVQLEAEIARLRKIRCWRCIAYRERELKQLKEQLKSKEYETD